MTEIDIVTKTMTEITAMISNVKTNPMSIIEVLINSIRYNPTAWIVSTAILIMSVFVFAYGLLARRKDYIIVAFFLLVVGTSLALLFYVSAVSGHKIELIRW
jgi:hypothetical protein